MRRRIAILAFGAVLGTSLPALADNPEALKAFEEGRKLRDQRDFDGAATAFERSAAAEPSIGAYYNIAFCDEQLGRPREALDAYRKALKLAIDKGDPRAKETNDTITKLLATHNYVTVLLQNEAENVPGLRVVVDGEVVPEKQLRGEVFRSPTRHEVVVFAPGRKERRYDADNRAEIRIGLGAPLPVATPNAPPPPPPKSEGPSGWGWQKWTGVGLVGAGLGGVAFSLIRVLSYVSQESSLDSDQQEKSKNCVQGPNGSVVKCDGNPSSPRIAPANAARQAYNDNEQSAKDGTPLTVGVGVAGLLLIGGGIYLFATAPSGSTEQAPPPQPPNALRVHLVPQIGTRESGLTLQGTF